MQAPCLLSNLHSNPPLWPKISPFSFNLWPALSTPLVSIHSLLLTIQVKGSMIPSRITNLWHFLPARGKMCHPSLHGSNFKSFAMNYLAKRCSRMYMYRISSSNWKESEVVFVICPISLNLFLCFILGRLFLCQVKLVVWNCIGSLT
jgi:hypothetical protein